MRIVLPEDVGLSAVLLPVGVADDRHLRLGARALLFRREHASEREVRRQRLEVVRRDDEDERAAGGVALGDAGERDALGQDAREDVGAVAHVDKVGVREAPVVVGTRAVLAVDADDLTRRALGGQRPEQQLVDQREHGAVGADAEREHDDRDGGETGPARHDTEAVAQILEQRGHRTLLTRGERVPAETGRKGRSWGSTWLGVRGFGGARVLGFPGSWVRVRGFSSLAPDAQRPTPAAVVSSRDATIEPVLVLIHRFGTPGMSTRSRRSGADNRNEAHGLRDQGGGRQSAAEDVRLRRAEDDVRRPRP